MDLSPFALLYLSLTSCTDAFQRDTDFPFMDMKVLATMGERSVCPDSLGEKLVGVPDGIGAYLIDDDTVRIIYQSESYGPLRFESYGHVVNDGAASIGGSHVHYIDYDRALMSEFMSNDEPASTMVVGMGQIINTMYNLKGEMVRYPENDGFLTTTLTLLTTPPLSQNLRLVLAAAMVLQPPALITVTLMLTVTTL